MTDHTRETSSPTLKETCTVPKTRGPNSCRNLKKKKGKGEISIQFDALNRPIGEYKEKFVCYIGALVRDRVNINSGTWPDVDATIKNSIWTDVKAQFGLQDDTQKSFVLKIAAKRWRDFKSRLKREYIVNKHPKYESPAQFYEYVSEESWLKFVANCESEEFKKRSEKAKERQACNVHPHFLGSAGYAGKKAEWMMSDPLSSQSSCASVSSTLLSDDRSFDWVRAKVKKSKEGNYYIPNEKTQEVFHKIIEKCDEVGQGTFQPHRHHDILFAALGKPEDKRGSGSVRGIGSYSTIRQVFGKPEQKQGIRSGFMSNDEVQVLMETVKQNALLEMQPKIDILTQQLNILLNNMSATHQGPPGVSISTPQSVYAPCFQPPTKSSCHSVDVYPVTTIKSRKKCILAICGFDGKPIDVAKGTVYPTTDEMTMVSDALLLPNHVKVMVDEVLDGAEQYNFPVPTLQHYTLAHIVGSHAQWPTHLVTLDEENVRTSSERQNMQMTGQSADQSATYIRPPIVGENVFLLLGTYCKELVRALSSFSVKKEYIDVELDSAVFHHANANAVYVMIDDIYNLMTLACLDVSIIQVFMLFLNKRGKQLGVTSIGFACPTQISADMVHLNSSSVTSHFIKVMEEHKDQHFILAPYHQKAFRSLSTIGGRTKAIDWKQCKCPQQSGGTECGYYVLRYMLEIVTKYSKVDCLHGIFDNEAPYSLNDIDEVRELWAEYFLEECV
ncbi:PREDICTED: uncharacterized protein LOC109183092 [Ipomoea nil]|uniref:uncharacterized protein LOC109183092 n=1 Tax=Ipomoea nil TaxID=35883 RepID=UPI000900E4BF|nr:PREDICTED: uncharacterized protein LOC109183092 [Ipomoea nil]